MKPRPALLPGEATLGVLGGGQLGRMFVHAAQALGYRCVVLEPDGNSPAGAVAHQHIRQAYLSEEGLAALAQSCQAVTTEFENVPAAALERLAASGPVAPAADAVRICQDRALEKTHFARSGVRCAPWARIESAADVQGVNDALLPGILKTARLGYDGKGQVVVNTRAELEAAWATMAGAPCVLEQRLALALELSVIVARGHDGAMVNLPVQQNLHRGGILAVTIVPAPDVPASLAAQAVACARALADGMAYVGVLCVEFFVLADGSLVANEMAPRPHNSGHCSINACDVSQFELQVRTLAALPLSQPRQHSAAVMLNLLGDLWFASPQGEGISAPGAPPTPQPTAQPTAARTPNWAAVLALPGVHLHLYGKPEPRPGRKMGHLTVTGADAATAHRVAQQAADLLGLPAWR